MDSSWSNRSKEELLALAREKGELTDLDLSIFEQDKVRELERDGELDRSHPIAGGWRPR